MLPVRIGVPGPVALGALIRYAVRSGVVASARALRRKPGIARLAGRWSPTPVALALARHLAAREDTASVDVHLFTFGGFADAAEWLSNLRNPDELAVLSAGKRLNRHTKRALTGGIPCGTAQSRSGDQRGPRRRARGLRPHGRRAHRRRRDGGPP